METTSEKTSGSNDVKTKLLERSLEYFASRGFEGASIRQIADAARVNYQAIVYHFGNKEQLWSQTAEYGFAKLEQSMAFPSGTLDMLDERQKLEMQLRSHIYAGAENRDLYKMMMREAMKQSPRYIKIFDKLIAQHSQNFRALFEQGQVAGIIRKDLPLDYLISIFFGASFWRLVAPHESAYETGLDISDPEVIKTHTDTIIKLFTT